MAQAPEFLTHLVRTALGRTADDVAAPETQRDGGMQGPAVPAPDSGEGAGPRLFDPGVVGVLAEKVLLAWLRNRYQLLFPFAFDLRRLDQAQAELVIHAMVAAAQADGTFDGKERERIEGTLDLVKLGEDERGFLAAAFDRPKPLNDVLREVHDVQTGAMVYAASLLAVDQRKPVNHYFLRYLAARLQLSEELVGSLEQRFRSSG